MKKINIFDILKSIDNEDISSYQSNQKEFSPFMTMRWLSGTKKKDQVKRVNQLMNSTVFSFYQHPELMYKLAICCTDGTQKRYKYPKLTVTKLDKRIDVIKDYLCITKKEATMLVNDFSLTDVKEMADELGYEKDEIKKIK